MALETLAGLSEIGGYRAFTMGHAKDYDQQFIVIHPNNRIISFKIQDGPIKENGVNGCQVDTLIAAAKVMLEGLDKKFPNEHNIIAIGYLSGALDELKLRTQERMIRGVEGTSQP